MKPVAVMFCLTVVGCLLLLVIKAGESDPQLLPPPELSQAEDIDPSVSNVNAWLRQHWDREGLEPAEIADDLTVYRRLSLALHGTIPSLEEISAFNSDASHDRIDRWTLKLLRDKRFAEYFSVRLSRVLTGVEEGQFVIFRRDRLQDWLADQLANDVPWDQVTRELIAAEGLWTSQPATNFITGAFVDGEGIDENELAGRTVRAFLGQRIDCAQCHDHPFDRWKQADFEGLAAFFGQASVMPGGVIDRPMIDGKPVVYRVVDPGRQEGRIVEPQVPFHPEWVTSTGNRRQQLASWVTHPKNRRFERAIANRIWGLMFGRSYHDPVDDLAHPEEAPEDKDVLDVLGRDYREHGNSIWFLIRAIAQSDAFRVASEVPNVGEDLYNHMTNEWAAFPLIRLRPEQMIGSLVQASGVRTIDQNSNLFVRFVRFTSENDFLKEYGDASDDELLQQTGTIPQALLRMNGKFTRESSAPGAFSAAGQILRFSVEDAAVVRNCFLACLTRLPTPEEQQFFVDMLRNSLSAEEAEAEAPGGDTREKRESFSKRQTVQDIFWILFNSPGFSWNR